MKRARSTSPATSHNNEKPVLTGASKPRSKYQRIEADTENDKELLWCTLEPTCSPPNKPTCLHSLDELETHYTQYHAYVCRAEGCTCVFSTAHYLNLHQTELHDTLAQIRKENGEPIYRCLVETCTHLSPSPNQRKRHLIQEHQYDENFFFAVTKVGIGGQLRAWGMHGSNTASSQVQRDSKMQVDGSQNDKSTALSANQRSRKPSNKSQRAITPQPTGDSVMDDLMTTMKGVSLVPSNVRFGRGGASKGGFERFSHKKRNASLSDIKIDLKREDDGDDEEDGMDETSDREDTPAGVRFAEEVAIRFLSPIDHRYNEGRRGRRKSGPRRGGRTGGVHSDDENSGRSARAENRGRGRGRGRGGFNAERGARPNGLPA